MVTGLVLSVELDGDHWDLVLFPTATDMTSALKPKWRLRMRAFDAYPDDTFDTIGLLHHVKDALMGLTGGYLEPCDRR